MRTSLGPGATTPWRWAASRARTWEIIILNGDRAIIHKWLEDSLVKVWEGKSPGEAGAVGTLRGSPDLLVITDVREGSP